MQTQPEPTQSPLDNEESTPAVPAHEADFSESRDDPQQAEELERQQDA